MIISSSGLAMPRLAEELGLSSVLQGSVVSIQFLGFALGALIGGTLADRYGRVRVLRFGFAGVGIATVVFVSSVHYMMAVSGVFFIGFFGSICQNAIVSLTTAYDSERADANNALVNVFFTVGAIITPLLLMLFMIELNLWRVAYYIISVLCISMSIYVLKYDEPSGSKSSSIKEAFIQYRVAFTKPIYLVAPLTLFLYVGAETGLWGFAPMLFEGRGYGKISGIVASVFIWVAMFLGRALSVKLLKKYDMVKILLAHGVLTIISLTCVIFSNQAAAIFWIAISGFACAPFYPFLTNWMIRLTGEKTSTMLAFNMAAGGFGPVVMGVFTGMVVDSFGSKYTTVIPAFVMVLAVMILFIFRSRKADNC